MNIPPDLIKEIANRNCIAFAGAGISQGAGLPGWPDLLRQMLDWYEKDGKKLTDRDELEEYIKKGDLLLVAQEMRERLGDNNFCDFMRDKFLDPKLKPTVSHNLLAKIPFAAIITPNYDKLMESSCTKFYGVEQHKFTHSDAAGLQRAMGDDRFYIFKSHGTIDDISTVILGKKDYRNIMHNNQAYQIYMQSIINNKTLLFIGFGLNDPDMDMIMDELDIAFKGYARKHYALMNSAEIKSIKQKQLENDYNIQIIPYMPSALHHPEVEAFLEDLAR